MSKKRHLFRSTCFFSIFDKLYKIFLFCVLLFLSVTIFTAKNWDIFMSLAHPERIFLVGPMGCGKTTIGKSLALISSRPFIDLDEEIVAFCKTSIPEIFKKEGEIGFRKQETLALKRSLSYEAVIATGGGIVVTKENIDLLKNNGLVVYLYADVETQYQRTLNDNGRPMIYAEDRKQRLSDIFDYRKPLFESVADITVDSGSHSVRECIELIQSKLEELTCKVSQ